MNCFDLPEVFSDDFDSYSEDLDKLQSLVRLIGYDTDLSSLDGPLCNFRTTTMCGKYVHWDTIEYDTIDVEAFPTVYAVGIIFDGDSGARVYITRKHGIMITISYGRYLFEEVRAGDLTAMGLMICDMADILDGTTYEDYE